MIDIDGATPIEQGGELFKKGDAAGAIPEFTKAISLDPNNAMAYYDRGEAKLVTSDFDGAIADMDKCLLLSPELLPAYIIRAMAKRAQGNFSGALADVNALLAIDPRAYGAFTGRGLIKRDTGDVGGAIADFSATIALKPGFAKAYVLRAYAESALGKSTAAIADCRSAIEANHQHYAYPYYSLWVLMARQDDKGRADDELRAGMAQSTRLWRAEWPSKVAAYLLNQTSEQELLSAAQASNAGDDAVRHCEAWYYIGIKQLLAKDAAAARDDFRKCRASNRLDWVEYSQAGFELQALH